MELFDGVCKFLNSLESVQKDFPYYRCAEVMLSCKMKPMFVEYLSPEIGTAYFRVTDMVNGDRIEFQNVDKLIKHLDALSYVEEEDTVDDFYYIVNTYSGRCITECEEGGQGEEIIWRGCLRDARVKARLLSYASEEEHKFCEHVVVKQVSYYYMDVPF